MVGNGQVFISHTPEDDALCAPLLEALRAWGVDFWYEVGGNGAEDEVPERQQRAITTRDTFIRVCSAHTVQSFEMTREFALFKRSVQETPRPELLVIFFIVSDGFVLDTVDNMSVAIDSVNSMPVVWQSALYHALGLSPQGQEGADVIVPALPAVQEQPAPEHLVEGDAWEPFHETATQPAPPFIVPEMPTTTHHPRQEVTSQSTPPPQQQQRPQRVLVLLALLVLVSCGSIGVVWHVHTTSTAQGNFTPGVGNAATAAIPTEQATSTPDTQGSTTATPAPDQPLPTVIPNTPLPPGAPPVSYADSATVTLTRATQSAQLPPTTVTISNTAGDARLRPTQVNDSATGTANPPAPYQDATAAPVTMTVTNPTNNDHKSIPGIINGTAGVSCTLQETVTVPAHTLQPQPVNCAEPLQYEPATTYYATLPNGLLYTGSAPAGGSVAGYRVPAGCGDINNVLPTAVHNLLQVFDTALQGAIRYTQQISNFPMTCIPDAGTTHPQPFGYQQSLTVTGTAVGYRPSDIQSYQQSHVSADAGTVLLSSAGCATPTINSVDQTTFSAVITCPATGTEATQLNLAALANLIVGKDPITATSILSGITGIVSGSVHITLSNHAVLPQNTTKIIFIITP